MSLSAAEVNKLKKAPPVDGIIPAILDRWSPRSFQEKPVPASDLVKIFEAARWSASSSNEQPWRFLVGHKGDGTYNKIYSTLIGFNQAWNKPVPVLILAVAANKFAASGAENATALYDLGAAASLLTLQATELGLATHSMAGFDRAAAKEALGIPADFTPVAVIAVGYQADPDALGIEKVIAMETAPRIRKPLGEIVFSAWGEPAKL